jgi:hypothetical protein
MLHRPDALWQQLPAALRHTIVEELAPIVKEVLHEHP